MKKEAENALENLTPSLVKHSGKNTKLEINKRYNFSGFELEFDENGAISYLNHAEYGNVFDKQKRCGLFVYEEIGRESYDFWFKNYIRDYSQNDWAYGDFGKPLFEAARTETREHFAYFDNGFYVNNEDSVTLIVNIKTDYYSTKELGCPKNIQVVYKISSCMQ